MVYTRLIIILTLVLLIGCNKNLEEKCFVQSCHFEEYKLNCEKSNLQCTSDLKPTDFCGKFVSCNGCNLIESPEYKKCLDCFKNCNPNNFDYENCSTKGYIEKFSEFL